MTGAWGMRLCLPARTIKTKKTIPHINVRRDRLMSDVTGDHVPPVSSLRQSFHGAAPLPSPAVLRGMTDNDPRRQNAALPNYPT